MAADEGYFEALDERTYRAREHTMSPWDRRMQHGGPPSALLAHAIERAYPRDDLRIAKIAFDFLGPIPIAELAVRTNVLRPGKRIELIEAALSFEGRDVVAARAWRIAVTPNLEASMPPHRIERDLPPPLPERDFESASLAASLADWPYQDSIEWRFVRGGGGALGPAAVWTRVRLPLVDGRAIAPLERLLVVVDSANGISAELPMTAWQFVPPGLTVAVHRHPRGEWTYLEASTTVGDDGIGLTEARYADAFGALGAGSQPLLVAART
jgi:hypothetical protein